MAKTNASGKQPPEEKQKKGKKISPFIYLNVLQIGFFMAYTIKGFMDDFKESKLLPFIFVLMSIYLVSFVVVIILNIKDAKKLKETGSEYKGGIKDLKLTIRVINNIAMIINVATAVLILIETYNSSPSIFKQVFALAAAAIAVFNCLKTTIKTSKKVKKSVKGKQKAKDKKEKEAAKESKKAA